MIKIEIITPDLAELLCRKITVDLPEYLAKIRLLLERGRVYHQSERLDQALSFFIQSYDLSRLSPEFDFHTVNAAHMVAIVEKHVEGKIEWNKRAINLAEQTKDERCHAWLGPIYNNLAQNYIEAEKYQEALQSFEKCKAHAEERGDQTLSVVLFGEWVEHYVV